jgi:hypothetical protein
VTLRPGAVAELWLPEDLTLPEASWLGIYLQRLAGGRVQGVSEARGNASEAPDGGTVTAASAPHP